MYLVMRKRGHCCSLNAAHAPIFALFLVLLYVVGAHGSLDRRFHLPRGQTSATVVPWGATGFGVVLDAGSSGTRIHVYVWKEEGRNELIGRPLLREVRIPGPGPVGFAWNKQHKPPIATLGSDPELVQNSLEPLLEHAKSILFSQPGVPEGKENLVLSCVPVIFGATGGMRMLSPDVAEEIMASVRTVLRRSAFLFKDEWARIISGEEEGVYGWVGANYLLNGLNVTGKGVDNSVAALDLGGASAQITYHPRGEPILADFFPCQSLRCLMVTFF